MQVNLDPETLKYLQDHLGFAHGFDDDQTKVYDRKVYRVPHPVILKVETRTVSTLASFAGYVKTDPDHFSLSEECWIHVESPSKVVLVGNPNEVREREIPLVAACPVQDLTDLGRFNNPAIVIPAVLAMQESDDRGDLLKMLSTVTRTSSEVLDDDMGGQTTKVEKGGGMKGWEPQKNPLILAPFRTFPEIRQPAGRFIVRWNQDAEVKVVESPDEGWRVLAVQEVRAALLEILGDEWAARVFA